VTVVVDPADYQPLLDKLGSGEDITDFRKQLAWKAFQVGSTVLAL
jgi:AICAR transformylase/IMP cyclohydrolase PurH